MNKSRKTLYEILEVSVDASIEEITDSYRRLVKQHADDRAAFDAITQAYMAVAHPGTREKYDEDLKRLGNYHVQERTAEVPPHAIPTISCPACGARNPQANKFCGTCGFLLTRAVELSSTPTRIGIGRLVAEGRTETYSFTEPRTTIGRTPSNDVVLHFDRYVSARHGIMHCDMGTFFMQDLGSTNGTYVDGERIKPGEKVRLEDGSKIRIGRTIFTFQIV